MIKTLEMVLVPKIKYIHNMQSKKGKSNIFCKVVKHKKDKKAIEVYTLNRKKEEIFLGYIKKNMIETIFTDEANELYLLAQSGEMSWEQAKALPAWGKVKKTIKHRLFSDKIEDEIIENINSNLYNFRFNFDENLGYLIIPF